MHENKTIAMATCRDSIYSVSHKKTVWQTADRKMDIKLPQLKKSTHNDVQQHMPLPVITEIAPFLHK